jgi:hypothetical protein
MKGGNSGNNGSDLDKDNIQAYHANHEKLFLSGCEVTRHGTALKDTTPIVFNKAEIIPEVRPNPSPSRNDTQVLINSTLEGKAKSTDKLLRTLIEERDTPGLLAATPRGFQYRDCRNPDNQHRNKYPSLGASHPSRKAPPPTAVIRQDSAWQDRL